MIAENLDISSVATLMIALSITMGVILAYIVAMRVLRQQAVVRESLQSIESRTFYSDTDEWRVRLEKQIADLNERLTDREVEFRSVNHLLVDSEAGSISVDKPSAVVSSPFLKAMNVPDAGVADDLIFVLTPFESREETTYAAVVEAFQGWGFRVLRGDEENVKSNILSHIIQLISQATIIIANVSTRNPNVMYELGIAQALGKRVVIISRSVEDVPFDLKNQRILLYRTRSDLIYRLRDSVGGLLVSELKQKNPERPIG